MIDNFLHFIKHFLEFNTVLDIYDILVRLHITGCCFLVGKNWNLFFVLLELFIAVKDLLSNLLVVGCKVVLFFSNFGWKFVDLLFLLAFHRLTKLFSFGCDVFLEFFVLFLSFLAFLLSFFLFKLFDLLGFYLQRFLFFLGLLNWLWLYRFLWFGLGFRRGFGLNLDNWLGFWLLLCPHWFCFWFRSLNSWNRLSFWWLWLFLLVALRGLRLGGVRIFTYYFLRYHNCTS